MIPRHGSSHIIPLSERNEPTGRYFRCYPDRHIDTTLRWAAKFGPVTNDRHMSGNRHLTAPNYAPGQQANDVVESHLIRIGSENKLCNRISDFETV